MARATKEEAAKRRPPIKSNLKIGPTPKRKSGEELKMNKSILKKKKK